ncbi:SWIM zinc finger family protein [Lysobacter capsici]|uniref:SWIM zinc finger family protein n=1 Tax=Lysobacter capsici TaxID=435897 RepID=UPI001BFFE8C9|nr:SWIM zinc finger family protein [Lysobacter capsici]QWF18235.1 SWIM zinc finger family protein [Lysobacter capsici]
MSPRRPDLLELSTDALIALANAGFVKRALKELDEGRMPQVEELDDGAVRAHYDDGQHATLAAGRSLREAVCSCPASGLCRHRVTLVLAYQRWVRDAMGAGASDAAASDPAASDANDAGRDALTDNAPQADAAPQRWTPAEFDDTAIAAGFPAATIDIATRLAAARPVIALQAGLGDNAPNARLPMCSVRFFSRSSLLHARCDCRQGSGCEHVVLAVWAFRQWQASRDEGAQATVELEPRQHGERAGVVGFDADAQSLRDELGRLCLRLWMDGSSQSPLLLEAPFERLRQRCAQLGWSWVLASLQRLQDLLIAQHARSTRFDPLQLLDAVAECTARVDAARRAGRAQVEAGIAPLPASQILGLGVKGEVALDHLRLVSLGAQCWQDQEAEGVRVLFADPDTQSVTVLERQWPRADTGASTATGAAPTALMARRIAGQTLRQFASGQVVTRGAKRRANGVIDIAAGARQTNVLPLAPQSWDQLRAPLRQPGARELSAHLRRALPDFVRPRQVIEHLHVLPVDAVLDWGWDAAEQTLRARLRSGGEGGVSEIDPADCLQLALPHSAAAVGAVDVLARALSGEWGAPRVVAGLARLQAGHLQVLPLALITEQRALVLQAESAPAQTLPMQTFDYAGSALAHQVEQTRQQLAAWLRQGLRHQNAAARERMRALATALEHAGLRRIAALLGDAVDAAGAVDPTRLPERMALLVLALDGVYRDAVE